MTSKLVLSTVLAASLIGAPAIALAQAGPAAPSESNSMQAPTPSSKGSMKSSTHTQSGATTGMSSQGKTHSGAKSGAKTPATAAPSDE